MWRDYTSKDDLVGAWSDEVTYTVTDTAVPAKIGGVKYDTATEYLSWNAVDNKEYYEVKVTDAAGQEYYSYYTTKEDGTPEFIHYSTSGTSLYVPGISYLDGYKVTGTVVETVASAFKIGQTYKVQVRAYNYKLDGTKQAGEWSDELTFTYAAATVSTPAKVGGVWVNNGYVQWKADEPADTDKNATTTKYQIAVTDESGKQYYSSASVKDGKINGTYWTQSGTGASITGGLSSMKTYEIVNDIATPSIHPETGDAVRAFEDGKKYAISVRAVRSGYENGEYVEKAGEWSDAVSYANPMPDKGLPTPPEKVSGVGVKTSADVDEYLTGARLYWSYVPNAAYYEFVVTDASGNEYSSYYEMKDGVFTRTYRDKDNDEELADEYQYISMTYLSGMKAYVKNDGVAVATLTDATTGKDLKTFAPGQTYSIKVRAVNTYQKWDASKNEYGKATEIPGEWSDPVTYTAGAIAPITNLKYESSDYDNYYFSYTEALQNSNVYYQVATDANFTSTSLLKGTESTWAQWDGSSYKLAISKTDYDFVAGTTYYVRAVNSANAPEKDELAALTPAVTSFVADAAVTPKNITGLYLYETTASGFTFRFDGVLDNEIDHYIFQYTDKASAAETDWVDCSADSNTLSMYSLKEGTFYVRAIAYVTVDGEKVYGTPSNVVSVTVSKATSAVGELTYAEKNQDGYLFKITGTPRKNESVEFWYSATPEFTSDRKLTVIKTGNDGEYQVDFTELIPGKTYYVRARVYNSQAAKDTETYSTFSNVVSFAAEMPRISVSSSAVTSTTVTLTMATATDQEYLTGYQVQKKRGSKYVTLTRTTNDTYKDTGLKANKTYTYRVRPYYYDTETGTTVTGAWKYYQTMTWGGALNLNANPKSKTSIKLSWDKVKGANGYEVYRYVSYSDATTVTNNKGNDFDKYTLVKRITKASTTSYTDKKLTNGVAYNYIVRAYRKVGTKRYYISESAYVNTAFGPAVNVRRAIQKADGTVKAYWTKIYAADGYVIEKYDDTTDKWTTIDTKKASVGSYTFPAASEETQYRIRAYKGNEYSEASTTITVYPYLAPVTGVTATANAADGSIAVSWNAVAGADCYIVFRTTSSKAVYDKTTKTYSYEEFSAVPVYKENAATVSGYETEGYRVENATSIVDRPITYTVNGVTKTEYAGPTAGVKYYYFVVPYKYNSYIFDSNVDEKSVAASGGSKAASATVTSVSVKKPTAKTLKDSKGKITVRWKKVADAQGYVVYRSTKKSSGFVKIALVSSGTKTSYADKSVTKGKRYYYKVRAIKYNEAGATTYSSYSKRKTAVAK